MANPFEFDYSVYNFRDGGRANSGGGNTPPDLIRRIAAVLGVIFILSWVVE